jgi:amidophosphoribosyltransferase
MENNTTDQDGAGFASVKLDVEPGERYISRRIESCSYKMFCQNDRVNEEMAAHPEYVDNVGFKSKYSYI